MPASFRYIVRDVDAAIEFYTTQLGFKLPKLTDDQLIDAMLANPILINRPIVVTPLGVKLCRPSEIVLDILPTPATATFR